MKQRPKTWLQCSLGLCLFTSFLFSQTPGAPPSVSPQDSAHTVEVYWQRSRTMSVPGLTSAVVLDQSVSAVEVSNERLTLTGVNRGDTLLLVWFGDRRESWLISVIDPPFSGRAPRLGGAWEQANGNGMFGSTVQTVFGTGQNANYVVSNRLFWTEEAMGGRLSVSSSFQDISETGTPAFNVTSGSILYVRKNLSIALFDSALDFTGGDGGATRFSQYANFNLRGLNVAWQRGADRFQFFVGTSVPYIFTTLAGTRDVFGMNYLRRLNPQFTFNATLAATNLPGHDLLGNLGRRTDLFQLAGLTWRPTEHWKLQATGGGSTSGLLGLAASSYSTPRLNLYGTYSRSSGNFPLNQLEALSTGQNDLSLGATYQPYTRLGLSGFYQHVVSQDNVFGSGTSTSDYINPSASLQLSERQRMYFNYILSRNNGTNILGNMSNHRFDVSYALQFPRFSNTVQTTLTSSGDPANLQSQLSFSLGDTVGMNVGHHTTLTAGVTTFRTNLSLTTRLFQQLGLLPPALQQLFLTDPNAFVQSVNFTPELKSILDDLQPGSTQVNVGAQFSIGTRVAVNPYFNYTHLTESSSLASDTHQFGYSLSYRVNDSLQLTSTLATLYLLDSRAALRRTTVLSVGFNKTMNGAPSEWLPFHLHHYALAGRVFRDMNLNGAFNAGEPGMAGITVKLSNGETAVTDDEGRYQFSGLAGGNYEVTLGLEQFHEQVRVTSPADRTVSVGGKHPTNADFGVVDFSRISGLVFNDYLNQDKREADAEGVAGVKVSFVGKNGIRDIVTEPDGSFEVTDITPGDYQMLVDTSTLPANFTAPAEALSLHVSPTVSLVRNVPLRALRSISGRVLLNVKVSEIDELAALGIKKPEVPAQAQEVSLPLEGVQLTADHAIATTDANGNFLLRNLPAGELTLSFVPQKALPSDLQLPSGKFKISRDPMQLQDTTVVISNLKLVPYLVSSGVPEAVH